MQLNQKVVWITGASSGIGRALAIALSAEGCRLILSGRNEKALSETQAACQHSESCRILALDLAELEELAPKVEEAWSLFEGIDIAILNAGISQRGLVRESSLSVDQRIFQVNYFGNIALTKQLLKHFRAASAGYFVVISSVVGKIGTPLRSSYAASKHALHGFFDSLRAEESTSGIRVGIICPGFVRTNVSINALTADGSAQGTMDKATENGISPERFAEKAVRFIRNEGQEIVIGGFLEKLGVYVKRFFPSLLARMVKKVDVT